MTVFCLFIFVDLCCITSGHQSFMKFFCAPPALFPAPFPSFPMIAWLQLVNDLRLICSVLCVFCFCFSFFLFPTPESARLVAIREELQSEYMCD